MKPRKAFQIPLCGFAAQLIGERGHIRLGQQRRRLRSGDGTYRKRNTQKHDVSHDDPSFGGLVFEFYASKNNI